MLENAFIVYKADRSDIRSKALLKTLGKYYIAENVSVKIALHTPMTTTEYKVLVSNASGKTSGNAEGVITGLPYSTSQITLSTGYIDPNNSNVYWEVEGK